MRFHLYKALGLAVAALSVAFLAQSCSNNGPGMGTLALTMGYQNSFSAASSNPIATQSDDGGSGDRTPLSDLILTFHSVQAWSCAGDDSLDDDDDDSTHADDSGIIQPLHDGEGEDEDDDCDAFTVLDDSTVTLSVGTLDSTLTNFLGNALLPEGHYEFLTLGNVQAWVVTAAGETLAAKVPSGRIKIKAPFTITDGGMTDLLVTFNLERSVVEAPPGSKNFIIKPVCHSQVGWDHDD
jgi:uncharacterized protein DUF4382